jgi:hypothetical protein
MNIRLNFITLLLLAGFGFQVQAQQYLYLVKKGETPYKRLGISDALKIKTAEDGEWVSGRISAISAESITLGKVTYAFSEIEAMRTYNSLMRTSGYTLGIGGVMFTGIALFNRAANGDTPLLYPGQIVTGAVLLGSGYILYLCSRKTYKKEDGWQYKVIDLEQ